jgi:hypothetical protein
MSAQTSFLNLGMFRRGVVPQASYAMQDNPVMVAQHFDRFLPQDKSEIAARILNQVWEAA